MFNKLTRAQDTFSVLESTIIEEIQLLKNVTRTGAKLWGKVAQKTCYAILFANENGKKKQVLDQSKTA